MLVAIGKPMLDFVSKGSNGRRSNLYHGLILPGTHRQINWQEHMLLAATQTIMLNGRSTFQVKPLPNSSLHQETLRYGFKL